MGETRTSIRLCAVIAAGRSYSHNGVLIASRLGKAILFDESDARPMGRTAAGVRGISLAEGDEVVGMEIIDPGAKILTLTENGYGKRTRLEDYRKQRRGGQGIINIKTTKRNGNVVAMMTVDDLDDIVVVATDGIVMRTSLKDIRTIGRNTQGVRIMKLREGAKVSAVARAVAEEQEDQLTEEDGDDA